MHSSAALSVNCSSEYGVLKEVLLCAPYYMRIEEVINRTQRYYAETNIDWVLAMRQHTELVRILRQNNVNVHILPSLEKYPEQVFTRDIGFVIGRRFFVSRLKKEIRSGETKVLKNWLQERRIEYTELKAGNIEGGDVIIHNKTLWLGISDRTSESVLSELAKNCEGYDIRPIVFDEGYLHFDCTFNIISDRDALIYRKALKKDDINRLESIFNLIDVSKEEQFKLGTNVLAIGGNRIISSPQNEDVNRKLKEYGYRVIQCDISEILKSGGAFRCVTLPLVRG
ncbi:MAG: dimethylarginine dimethylaminohydrolase family protein [Oscillospiraceae bacterium]|jgi:N-dimethylarginine dimethylaminohydrolase